MIMIRSFVFFAGNLLLCQGFFRLNDVSNNILPIFSSRNARLDEVSSTKYPHFAMAIHYLDIVINEIRYLRSEELLIYSPQAILLLLMK